MKCTPETLTPETMAAMDIAHRKAMGQHIPDSLVQDSFPAGPQAAFAHITNNFRNVLATDFEPRLPSAKENSALQAMGAVKSWITILQDAQPVLSEEYCQPLLDALQSHWEATKGLDGEAYKRDVLPVIEQLRAELQDHFSDPGRINFANDWLDFWEGGGRLYKNTIQDANVPGSGLAGRIWKVVMYPIRTAAENLVVNNPFIASAHTLQVLPKSVAYYGPSATLRGLVEYAKGIGTHKLFGEDPELAARGIYRNHSEGFNLVNFGDNLAKGIAYRVGEAAGKDPLDAVQHIAYQYRLGREPMITWHTENAAQVYLMRFAIESSKMYGGWLANIVNGARRGDWAMARKGAAALAGFTVTQSMFTGVKSSVPAFVYPFLSDEDKQTIDEWDQLPFLNLAGHATGRDFQHFQPGGGFALGVGADIVNTDLKGAYSHGNKGVEAWRDQDFTRAGVEFGKAFFSGSQPVIPGVRLTYKKAFDLAGDLITGDMTLDELPDKAAEKFHFPAASGQ